MALSLHIALATRADLPDWEVDDRPFHAALRERGVIVSQPIWDDPTVDWATFDACLIRTTWDYSWRCEEFVAWAERCAGRTLLLNPYPIVRWNTHKRYLRELEAKGVAIIPTVWAGPENRVELAALLSERNWSRAFFKPAIGASSRETRRFSNEPMELAEAQAHLDRLAERDEVLIQPYLSSVETEGEVSVILIDGEVTHCVRKRPVPGDYRVQDDYGATDEPADLPAEVIAAAHAALTAVDSTLLYARADFICNGSGQHLLTELELVEPSLFFRHGPRAAKRLAIGLIGRMEFSRSR